MVKLKKAVEARRERFIKEYLIDQNATRAAIAAGYSKNGAENAGYRLLRNVQVREKITQEREEVSKKLDITIERVLIELARLAFFDPRKFFDQKGNPKPIVDLDEDTARAIAGFEVEEQFDGRGEDRTLSGYVKKYKLPDKGQNLERLGRHLQMFPSPPQELKVNGRLQLPVDVAGAREKLLAAFSDHDADDTAAEET